MTRYCALAYSAQGRPPADYLFIVLAELRSGVWKLLVRPGWPAVVALDDQSYVGEMLADMKSRLTEDPDSLFQQLSSLSVGPLTTYAAGQIVQNNPQVVGVLPEFVEMS